MPYESCGRNGEGNLRPLRILIADDNATIRRLLREFRESEPEGIVCGEAVDGNDALIKAVELKPDLLLLDISMPQMGGWQVCQSIREELPEMKILLIAEHDPDLMKIAVLEGQAHGFVTKSEAVSSLKVAVEAAMNNQPHV
jgi:DNA-binding NarL/FixJ family response regulator